MSEKPPNIELSIIVTAPPEPPPSNDLPINSERKFSETSLQIIKTFSTQERENRQGDHQNDDPQTSQTFSLIRLSRRDRTKVATDTSTEPKLKNNLLISVGFLDLASACDFPANIWNDYPVPRYALVLMVFGGLFALTISCFAVHDFRLSYPNFKNLLSERRFLKTRRSKRCLQAGVSEEYGDSEEYITDLDACLEVNFRELGNEVARLVMDAVLGFGVCLVGIGTLMATGGSHPKVFHASNLLSGYIGNAPIAFYGLINSAWSIYLWRKTYHHSHAGQKFFKRKRPRSRVRTTLEKRTKWVRLYSALYGVAGFFTGVGSLISSTMWFGYLISFPWIITSVYCNWLFRSRIGYDRLMLRDVDFGGAEPEAGGALVGSGGGVRMTKESLIQEVEEISSYKSMILSPPHEESSSPVKANTASTVLFHSKTPHEIFQFLLKYNLFDDFCHTLLRYQNSSLFNELVDSVIIDMTSKELSTKRFRKRKTIYTIDSSKLLQEIEDQQSPFQARLVELAKEVVDEFGLIRLRHRKRFLVEVLGCWLCNGGRRKGRELSVEEGRGSGEEP